MAKSLKTEFVNYYKQKLEPYGFKKVKGKQPYFVRVIDDEILHIFTFEPRPSLENSYKNFWLMCGVATIYRKEINFSVAPSQNSDWLVPLVSICEKKETDYPDRRQLRDFKDFYYNEDIINEILEGTENGAEIIISELDKVKNMDDALRYFLKYNFSNVTFQRWQDKSFFDEESLYYARKKFDYKKMEKIFEEKRLDLKNSSLSEEEKKESYKGLLAWEERLKNARDKLLSSGHDYEEGMRLLKEHYDTNADKLQEYGLEINRRELEF